MIAHGAPVARRMCYSPTPRPTGHWIPWDEGSNIVSMVDNIHILRDEYGVPINNLFDKLPTADPLGRLLCLREGHLSGSSWRGDVSLVVTDAARIIEWVQYSAYGVPFGIPAGNASSNGANNVEDLSTLVNWINNIVWDARWDLNADGSVTVADYASYPEKTLGRGKLSWVNNRIGYAAYQHAPELAGTKWHVRHRWLLADLMIFNRRDPHPMPVSDGRTLYGYVGSEPAVSWDPDVLLLSSGELAAPCSPIRCRQGFSTGVRNLAAGSRQPAVQCEGRYYFAKKGEPCPPGYSVWRSLLKCTNSEIGWNYLYCLRCVGRCPQAPSLPPFQCQPVTVTRELSHPVFGDCTWTVTVCDCIGET
jgi:hypothetical protein